MAASVEEILEQIRDQASLHEQARQLSHKEMVDMAKTDEALSAKMQEYSERQQGIENQFAKIQQHRLEQQLEKTDHLTGSQVQTTTAVDTVADSIDVGEQLATKEGTEESTDELKETIIEEGKRSFKQNAANWTDQFSNSLEERASFKQFQGALKTDLALFQGKMQFLTQIPGIQFIMAGLKLVFSRLALWFYKGKFGQKILGPESPLGKMLESWRESNKKSEDTAEAIKDEQVRTTEGIAKVIDIFSGKEITPTEETETFKGANQYGEYETESSRVREKEQYRDPKTGRYAPDPADMSLGDQLKQSYDNFKGSLTLLSGTLSTMWGKGMKALTVAFTTASTWLISSITGLTAAEIAAAGGLTAVTGGLIMASLPFIAIGVGIALLVAALVMFGMWLYGQKDVIMEKWEVFKEKFKAGWDKIVEVATFVKNWLGDKSTDIKLKIKHMIAVVMDGIAAIVNGLIDGMKEKFPRLAKFFNVDQYKMEGGNVAAVAKQRSDFEAMKQNRDMNAAGTAVRNAEGEIVTGTGGESTSNNVINTNSKNSTTLITEKTTSSDSFANGQNASGF